MFQFGFVRIAVTISIVCLSSSGRLLAFETNGDLDLSFTPPKITNGLVSAVLVQPDGKVVVGGSFGKLNNVSRFNIGRLNSDGSLDATFDPGSGTDGSQINQLVRQSDGKLLIVGGFTLVNGVNRLPGLARLNSDGSLDTAFNPGASLDSGTGQVYWIVLQNDGKVIVVGAFSTINDGGTMYYQSCVARFNGDGTFDPSYNPGSGMTDATSGYPIAYYAVKQSSGKIVIQGQFDHFNGNAVPQIVRLNTDGSYDATFNPGTGANPPTQSVTSGILGLFAQSDDKIVVFGGLTSFNGTSCHGIVRLSVDGAVDSTFSAGNFQDYSSAGLIESVAQQSDGKLLVGGQFSSIDASALVSVYSTGS
jgi:uncharacterized delta-60 repeat protein